jgi:simple sugar transport system ATP-binding protein
MRGVCKSFGDVRALEDVSLSLEAGRIHAVVGENGAGKTTLMRVLYGALRPDAGTIEVGGAEVRFRNSADAGRAGVGMVSQHYSVIPQLTCLENLMLGAEPGAVIGRRVARERADRLASEMGFSFDWHREASSLSPAGAQKLEILKLLWREARIMILDEPTAMLSPADGEALFAALRGLAERGAAIVLVTHRLPEVIDHCRTVTVLRGGRLVAEAQVEDTTAARLAEWMIGHSLAEPPAAPSAVRNAPMLEIENLRARGARGHEALKGVSLRVRSGEMVGVAGVDGSGQRELFQTVLGLVKPTAGTVSLGGVTLGGASTRARLAKGMRVIPEDRLAEGLVAEWSLAENAALGLQRLSPFARGPLTDESARDAKALEAASRFDVKHGGVRSKFAGLSGGNQQRFVAGRALCLEPRLVLAFQPARGLDVEAARRLYEAFRAECGNGAGVLVVGFDLDELLENCDRVVAMRSGEIYEPAEGKELDRAAIGALMVGAS